MADILVLFASKSDESAYRQILKILDKNKVSYDFKLASAHKTPEDVDRIVSSSDCKVVVSGATLTVSEVGVKYNFGDCGDQVYNDLIKESEVLKEKIKERESYLKTIPKEGTVCPIHGNFINRPSKSSKTKVIVRL